MGQLELEELQPSYTYRRPFFVVLETDVPNQSQFSCHRHVIGESLGKSYRLGERKCWKKGPLQTTQTKKTVPEIWVP